jgi:hypothetical protein
LKGINYADNKAKQETRYTLHINTQQEEEEEEEEEEEKERENKFRLPQL